MNYSKSSRKVVCLGFFLALHSLSAPANELSKAPKIVESLIPIGSPHPALLEDLKIDGFDYIEASVDIKDKGASISWAPFLLTKKYSFLSETRLQLSQKDSLTSLGIAFKYNPLNPRSRHNKSIFPQALNQTHSSYMTIAKSVRVKELEKENLDILAGPPEQSCKITLSEFSGYAQAKPGSKHSSPAVARMKCGYRYAEKIISQLDKQVSELDSMLPSENQKITKLKEKAMPWRAAKASVRIQLESHLVRVGEAEHEKLLANKASIKVLNDEINAQAGAVDAKAYLAYREQLSLNRLPVLSFSYFNKYFDVIGGDDFDADNNGKNDNEFSTKSKTFSAAVDWRFSEKNQISLILAKSKVRESAEAGNELLDYDSYGITWSHRLRVLNKDGFTKTKDYRDSLFIPSINVGLAIEENKCKAAQSTCIKSIVKQSAVTPFIEFKISKTAQFRVGLPFKRSRIFEKGEEKVDDKVELQALIAFQLGSP